MRTCDLQRYRIGRRGFLRAAAATTLLCLAGTDRLALGRTRNDGSLRVGVIWPTEDAALMGVRLGAAEAAHAARLMRSEFALYEAVVPEGDAGAAAADLIREADVHALVGGASPVAANALVAAAAANGVLFVNIGVPMESLTQRCSPLVFHVYASEAMRRDALEASPADSPPGARVLAWHPALTRYGAAQVNERFERASGAPMTEPAWNGWLAVKILFDAVQRAGSAAGADLAAHLASARTLFDGHKGVQLSFRPQSHQLRQPLYVVASDRVHAEVPSRPRGGTVTHTQLLDTLGVAGGDSCTS